MARHGAGFGLGDGFELWSGRSEVDGRAIGVVVTHLTRAPLNRKLGDMSQAWILPRDVAPNEAVHNGADRSVCGSCRFRPGAGGGCYVSVPHTAQRVWYTWREWGSYAPVAGALPPVVQRKPCRIGAWGDPGAVPIDVWWRLLEYVPSWTAYTHRWRELDAAEWSWCMASVDTAEERAEARDLGWRTFRVRSESQTRLASEKVCPAAEEAPTHGRATCAMCRLCNGTRDVGKPPDVAIITHGHRHRIATATIDRAELVAK